VREPEPSWGPGNDADVLLPVVIAELILIIFDINCFDPIRGMIWRIEDFDDGLVQQDKHHGYVPDRTS